VTTAIGNPAPLGAHRVHNKHSHFDTTTSPKYALAPTLQKSSTNSYGSRALGVSIFFRAFSLYTEWYCIQYRERESKIFLINEIILNEKPFF
jgi:hypothetical protein